jgi:hypothetical protein
MSSDPSRNSVPASALISTFLIGNEDSQLYSITDGIVRLDKNIPLEDALKLGEQDPIWNNRGKAIQAYAILEQSLCFLLSGLAAVDLDTAGTIFYKVTNTGSRNGILEKLLHKKHGTRFNLFWNAYFKEMRQIDLRRNAIVHWLSAMNAAINAQNMMIIGITLIPPGSIHGRPPEHITSKDLIAFTDKCTVFARLCTMFSGLTSDRMSNDDIKKTWLDIFQQPLVYPLPADHPLNRTPVKPDIPPQSSQA